MNINGKNYDLSLMCLRIIFFFGISIIVLQTIWYFLYNSKFLDKYTLIGLILISYSYYFLFINK